MKVLLTGASGFVGSHILDALCAREMAVVLLLRHSSSLRFIEPHMPQVEVRRGALDDPASLVAALAGVTHVIHCAGIIKARLASEFDRINALGTRHLVEAVNSRAGSVVRLVHLSSMAAGGPGTFAAPAREGADPRPVSAYGRSKLAAEREVTANCRTDFVLVRPPGVYGPRDAAFLSLFRAVQRGLCPRFGRRPQELSLVHVHDLAKVVVALLEHPKAQGLTVNVASAEMVTGDQLCQEISGALGVRGRRLTLPFWVLRAACWAADVVAALTGCPSIIGSDKYHELAAPGWVCDTTRLRHELGLDCPTRLGDGVRKTVVWYREHGWL